MYGHQTTSALLPTVAATAAASTATEYSLDAVLKEWLKLIMGWTSDLNPIIEIIIHYVKIISPLESVLIADSSAVPLPPVSKPDQKADPTAEAKLSAIGTPDFKALFTSAPTPYLVLLRDAKFTIYEVNDAYLQSTMTKRNAIIGKGIFEIFPDNPLDPQATGVRNLRQSLESVVRNGKPHMMAIQKYDIPHPEKSD